jgi:MFS family permease
MIQLVVAPWWGRLSDRIGRRPVLLVGLFGSAASYVLFGVARSLTVLFVSRIVAGATGATVHVAQAALADETPPDRRAGAMGWLGAAFGVAFIVGPALAGIGSRLGEGAPGFLAAALTGGAGLVALGTLTETRGGTAAVTARVALPRGRFLAPLLVMFFETFAFTVMYAIFTLLAERELGYGRETIAYLFVYIGLVTAVVQGGLVGRLTRRGREPLLMIIGSLLLAVGLVAVPASAAVHSPLVLLLGALLLVGVGTALVTPSVAGYLSRNTGSEDQGRVLGVLQSVTATARIAGPVAFGVVSDWRGIEGPFIVAAACAAVAAGIAGRTAAGRRTRPVEPAAS